ncbi:hypothetical protein [Synechococcus sp. CBW1004]|uniref:hypothetical protein n=1 Tax=Synechococcus sp. CBW1004 TaxID=1353136 RepID=UPI001E618CD7|nr:hypothetical protein [Synechococcus sp. CBW1004]
MALTSTVLAFDNIISIDYPWATFFWVIGCATLKNSKARSNSIIPMALAIGSRPIFALFAISSIYLIDHKFSREPANWIVRFKERLSTIITTTFAGGLFYLPAWFWHNFGLSWISAEPPDNQGLIGLAGRFILKLIQAFGLVQTLIIIVIVVLLVMAKRNRNHTLLIMSKHDANFLGAIVISNLLIFARMPVQLSYLQPLLLCCFYILSRLRNSKLLIAALMIIGFNLINWTWQPRIVKIDYESDDICSKTVATGAKIQLWVDDGRILEFEKGSRKAKCYRGWFGQIKQADYSPVIINGQPLRLAIDNGK